MYSIPSYVDDLFDENSSMNKSIEQLEDIIHKQIYDSALCILTSTRIEQEMYEDYKEKTKSIKNAADLRNLLYERDVYESLHSVRIPNAIRKTVPNSTLLLYKTTDESQQYNLEEDAQNVSSLPMSRIVYGTQLAQNLKRKYTAYGLISSDHIHKDVKTIIHNAISTKAFDESDRVELVKYAIKSLYEYNEYFFNLSVPKGYTIDECIFIGEGCKKIAKEIRKRFTDINTTDKDQLHEILSCASVLESLNYSGSIICFVGGIKSSRFDKTGSVDELDGFIYLPSKSLDDGFAYIIEAKNYTGGEEDAAKQLKNTSAFLDRKLNQDIVKMSKCAYMKIYRN